MAGEPSTTATKLVAAEPSQMGTTALWKEVLILATATATLSGHAQTVSVPDPSESSDLPVVEEDSQRVLARTRRARG